MPLVKRVFDIIFSLTALLFLSPLFLIIAILLRLDSKGPIFYASKRAGTGYRVFNFYKFRSMAVDADKRLKEISHLNQYAKKKEPTVEVEKPKNSKCEECALYETECKFPLHFDSYSVCEKIYMLELGEKVDGKFIKVKNDPRVTKFGAFIRNTSIDELPQLFNVLKGDMSIVGNRPLPLYEAEKLTTDQFTLRFMAPAGITGLWQVTKRGKKGPMSDEERMELDNEYARNYSLMRDIEIILKTVPALLQKENV
ncbi:MAG: sugar transferase [Cytophagales bacterium]|nr:sugar transferase [Cytophagales bacterium]